MSWVEESRLRRRVSVIYRSSTLPRNSGIARALAFRFRSIDVSRSYAMLQVSFNRCMTHGARYHCYSNRSPSRTSHVALPCPPESTGTRYDPSAGHTGTDRGRDYCAAPESQTLPQVSAHADAGRQSTPVRLYVITVHWLDPRKWEDPWRRRRRRP